VVADHTAPQLGQRSIAASVLATHSLRIVLAPTERVTATVTATVRVAGRTYRLPVVNRRLRAGGSTGVRVAVRRDVRDAIAAALRRRLPVRARATVALVDRAGNASATVVSGRVTA